MSKLELDDQILNHDKFVLAVKRAGKFGGDIVFMWLGIRAYCGQRLTDGFIPTEMLGEVRGPLDPKQREAAVKALRDIGLLETVDGGLQMHDYLQWSRSKSQVLADRARARERQAKSRGESRRDSGGGHNGSDGGSSGRVTKASGSSSVSSSATTTGERSSPDPDALVACPVPLPLDDDDFAGLELDVGMPRDVAEFHLLAWARAEKAAKSNPRPVGAWIKCGLAAVRGKWSSQKAEMRIAARPQQEGAPALKDELRWV